MLFHYVISFVLLMVGTVAYLMILEYFHLL